MKHTTSSDKQLFDLTTLVEQVDKILATPITIRKQQLLGNTNATQLAQMTLVWDLVDMCLLERPMPFARQDRSHGFDHLQSLFQELSLLEQTFLN